MLSKDEITVKDLIEFLEQYPSDTHCWLDYGNPLTVVYDEYTKTIDFH